MRHLSLSLSPILVMLAALSVLLGSVAFALIAVPRLSMEQKEVVLDFVELEALSAETVELTMQLIGPHSNPTLDTNSILSASPFHKTRAPYTRAAPAAASPVVQDLRPEILGFLGRGPARRVLVDWNNGAPVETLQLDASTPWGRLVDIGETELTFQDGDKSRTLNLF